MSYGLYKLSLLLVGLSTSFSPEVRAGITLGKCLGSQSWKLTKSMVEGAGFKPCRDTSSKIPGDEGELWLSAKCASYKLVLHCTKPHHELQPYVSLITLEPDTDKALTREMVTAWMEQLVSIVSKSHSLQCGSKKEKDLFGKDLEISCTEKGNSEQKWVLSFTDPQSIDPKMLTISIRKR